LAVTLHVEVANSRVRLRSILRKTFLSWARSSVLKPRYARILCEKLKEMVLLRSRSSILHWHTEARRRTGVVRLVRWAQRHLLQRRCAPAFGTWQRWSAAAYTSVLARKQHEAEVQVAQLRKASEELMAYHRLELESWQHRCEDEQAFIETLGHERRDLSSAREGDFVDSSSVCASRSTNVFNASDTENAKTFVGDYSAAHMFQHPSQPQSLLPTCPELPALDASFYNSCASPPAAIEDTVVLGRRVKHTQVEGTRAIGASSMATVQLLRDLRTDIAAEVQRSKDDRTVTDKDELKIKSVEARINSCIGRLGAHLPQNDSSASQSSRANIAHESASRSLASNAHMRSGRAANLCGPSQTSLQNELQASQLLLHAEGTCVLGAGLTALDCRTRPPAFAESSSFFRGIAHTEVGLEDPTSAFKASSQFHAHASRSLAGHGSTCRPTTLINDLSPPLGLSSSSTTPSTQGSLWNQTTPPSSSHRSVGSTDSSVAQLVFSNARDNRLSIRRDLEDHSDSSSWSEGSGSSDGSSPRRRHGSASNSRHIRARNIDWTQHKPQSSVVSWPSTQRSRSYSTGRIPIGDPFAVAIEGTRFNFGAAAGAGAGLPITRPPHSSCTVDTAIHSFRSNSQGACASAKAAFTTSGGIRNRDTNIRFSSVERQVRSSERQPGSSKQTAWRS